MNYELGMAMLWWNELTNEKRKELAGSKTQTLLTGREILIIFNQQNQ